MAGWRLNLRTGSRDAGYQDTLNRLIAALVAGLAEVGLAGGTLDGQLDGE